MTLWWQSMVIAGRRSRTCVGHGDRLESALTVVWWTAAQPIPVSEPRIAQRRWPVSSSKRDYLTKYT